MPASPRAIHAGAAGAHRCLRARRRTANPIVAAKRRTPSGKLTLIMAGPYELYLIRHGIAEERGDRWPDDAKRPLTEDGIDRLRKEARGLARLGISIDLVLTSPLVRTKQTAEIVA